MHNTKELKSKKGAVYNMVYVISKDGQPLMPMRRHGKVRRLLDSKRAKVVRRNPFTIKLLFETEKTEPNLTLGVDTGSSKIGCAVVTPKKEVLYVSEVEIRNDITTKMERRKVYRRARRNRKTRYRKPRFLNRRNSIKKDRLNPTMTSKINSHIREIEFIKSILPIKQIILETGTFDPHLLKMQEEDKPFNKHWGYQKGPNYGFGNVKAACLNRDNYTCKCCKTKKGTLHVHHIVYRSNGGADTLDNLITLCEECHKKLHAGKLESFESKLIGKRKGNLKHATQMNIIRSRLLKHYPDAIETFGYITKENRQFVELEKTHYNDAVVIAMGTLDKPNFITDFVYKKKHVAKGRYQLYQGQRSEQKLPKGKILGFLTRDIVNYRGQSYLIKKIMSSGYCVLTDIDGAIQKFENPKTVKLNSIKRISARNTTRCISQRTIKNTA